MTNFTRTMLLAALLAAVAAPTMAQTADPAATTTDTVVVDSDRDDNDFPWGLLGLLGLAGLMGRKRDTTVVRHDTNANVNDTTRR